MKIRQAFIKMASAMIIVSTSIVAGSQTPAHAASIRIVSNTTWSDLSSPYEYSEGVEVAEGATLTIGSGVRVKNTEFALYGNLTIQGSSISRIELDNVRVRGPNTMSAPYPRLNMQYATIQTNPDFFMSGQFGTSSIADSYFLSNEANNSQSYIWYPGGNISFSKNVFVNHFFRVGHNSSRNISFTENKFFGRSGVENWAAYSGTTSLTDNYFATPYVGVLELPSGYDSSRMSAASNYWEGANGSESSVKAWILDRDDSSSRASVISVNPLLGSIPAGVPQYSLETTSSTGAVSLIGTSSASVTGSVNASFMTTSASVVYGTTATLLTGTTTQLMGSATGDTATSLTTDLTGLSPQTTYYYKVVATNSLGTTTGTIRSFTTLGSVPSVASEQSSGLSVSGATVSASVGAGLLSTEASVVYGTSATLLTGTSTQSMGSATGDTATSLTTDLTGLSPQTKYYFKVVATNSLGTTTGTIESFTTVQDSATASIQRTTTLGGAKASGPVLTGSDVFLDARSSKAAGGVVTKFEWDLDGDGTYEIDGRQAGTYTTKFTKVGMISVGVRVTGRGGLDDTETISIDVRKSPPAGESGVSIVEGSAFTNTKAVKLNLIWPAFATEARISNDGGFASSKTKTFIVAESIDWELDDSVKGIFTKVVYVRFSGSEIDTTKTYSDDIILDTNAPVLESSSVVLGAGKVDLSLKATDDITGVDKVEIKNGVTTVTKDYKPKISVSEKELGMAVSSSGVRKMGVSSIQIRVSDNAGNWSSYQTLSLSGNVNTPNTATPNTATPNTATSTSPKVTMSKPVSAKSMATYAKLKVASTSKVSLKVVSAYAKYCKVSGTTLKGLKAGSCKVTVTVTPKKGRATSKTVTLKVTK